jgi:hypothetical protein
MVPFLSLDSPRKQTLLVIQFFFLKLFSVVEPPKRTCHTNISEKLDSELYIRRFRSFVLHGVVSSLNLTIYPTTFHSSQKKQSSQFLAASPYAVSSSLSHTINFHVWSNQPWFTTPNPSLEPSIIWLTFTFPFSLIVIPQLLTIQCPWSRSLLRPPLLSLSGEVSCGFYLFFFLYIYILIFRDKITFKVEDLNYY